TGRVEPCTDRQSRSKSKARQATIVCSVSGVFDSANTVTANGEVIIGHAVTIDSSICPESEPVRIKRLNSVSRWRCNCRNVCGDIAGEPRRTKDHAVGAGGFDQDKL